MAATLSADLDIATELKGLWITERLCEAYRRHLREFVELHDFVRSEVPVRLFCQLGSLALHSKGPAVASVLRQLQEKKPKVHQYVLCIKHLCWIETVVQGELTHERLARKREAVYERFKQLNTPYELMELWLRPYQKRPRGAPAKKTVLYLRALDFKNAHPATSWGTLAQKFCGSSAQSNTLKSWAYGMKKELADVGVEINLRNPAYAPEQRPPKRRQ